MANTLYRSPVDVLRREMECLKQRLRDERREAKQLEARLIDDKSEGLAKLLDIVLADVDRTAELVSEYRKTIRKLGGG